MHKGRSREENHARSWLAAGPAVRAVLPPLLPHAGPNWGLGSGTGLPRPVLTTQQDSKAGCHPSSLLQQASPPPHPDQGSESRGRGLWAHPHPPMSATIFPPAPAQPDHLTWTQGLGQGVPGLGLRGPGDHSQDSW